MSSGLLVWVLLVFRLWFLIFLGGGFLVFCLFWFWVVFFPHVDQKTWKKGSDNSASFFIYHCCSTPSLKDYMHSPSAECTEINLLNYFLSSLNLYKSDHMIFLVLENMIFLFSLLLRNYFAFFFPPEYISILRFVDIYTEVISKTT